MIEVRKLAAIDMLWLGPRIVIAEYALESGCPLRWEPLFLHAVSLVRAGTVEQEGRAALVHSRRYSLQQTMLLVPFVVVIVALAQRRSMSLDQGPGRIAHPPRGG